MPSVSVTINGKNYRMACDDGQEAHLEELAVLFDKYVDQLKGSFGEIGDQRLTVMAGVMVTDELVELKKRTSSLEEELKNLQEKRALQTRKRQEGDDDLAKGIDDAAHKIEQLSFKLVSDAKS